jgi:hypothetical protein
MGGINMKAPLRSSCALLALSALLAGGPGLAVADVAMLDVLVSDGRTGAALPGAFVMVGRWVGEPFAGNYGWTDATGMIRFEHPALAQPQTVTAGAVDFGYTTLCDAALGAIEIPIYPTLPDSTMAGARARVSGQVQNIAVTSNDSKFDIALVMPSVPVSDYALQDKLGFIVWPETVTFPVVGAVQMPSNSYLPTQIEYIFFSFAKSPYALDVPAGGRTTFYSVSARIPISDLLGGSIANAVVREIGVERNVLVAGPMTLQINSDLNTTQGLTAAIQNVPPGAKVQAISAGLLSVDGIDYAVGYDTKGDLLVVRDATYTLAGLNPTGDLSDAVSVAVGTYSDSSAAAVYSAGIIDRAGFTLPHTSTFDTWMLVPELTQLQREYAWSDPTDPGVSPSPTWTRSNLGLRAVDASDSTIQTTVHWRVYAPAAAGAFELPALPDVAPGPPGGLPDPAATPEADQLYWRLVAANSTGDAQLELNDFLHGATHWTSRWAPIDAPTAGVPAEIARPALMDLRTVPSPADAQLRLRWDRGLAGEGVLEVLAADGRLVHRERVALARGEAQWDGRDARGEPVAGGIYWARLRQGPELLGRGRVVRLAR